MFTFESSGSHKLETYEWDSVWYEYAFDKEAKRVLYIGDSISVGTRHAATKLSNENLLFDGYGTSKALDNPYFKDSVKLFAAQQPRRDAVLFNNGLHGFHLSDENEYGEYYESMVEFLMEEFKNCLIMIVLSTALKDEEANKRVILRNEAAKHVAKKHMLPIIDLYAVSSAHISEIDGDGVHFSETEYVPFAEEVVKRVYEETNISLSDLK